MGQAIRNTARATVGYERRNSRTAGVAWARARPATSHLDTASQSPVQHQSMPVIGHVLLWAERYSCAGRPKAPAGRGSGQGVGGRE
eukprot:9995541-Alexandrium_andersonii.AAC.1